MALNAHDDSQFGFGFIGGPAGIPAALATLEFGGPLIIALDGVLGHMLPEAVDKESYAGVAVIYMVDLMGARRRSPDPFVGG